jgi:hypothetical protein
MRQTAAAAAATLQAAALAHPHAEAMVCPRAYAWSCTDEVALATFAMGLLREWVADPLCRRGLPRELLPEVPGWIAFAYTGSRSSSSLAPLTRLLHFSVPCFWWRHQCGAAPGAVRRDRRRRVAGAQAISGGRFCTLSDGRLRAAVCSQQTLCFVARVCRAQLPF